MRKLKTNEGVILSPINKKIAFLQHLVKVRKTLLLKLKAALIQKNYFKQPSDIKNSLEQKSEGFFFDYAQEISLKLLFNSNNSNLRNTKEIYFPSTMHSLFQFNDYVKFERHSSKPKLEPCGFLDFCNFTVQLETF